MIKSRLYVNVCSKECMTAPPTSRLPRLCKGSVNQDVVVVEKAVNVAAMAVEIKRLSVEADKVRTARKIHRHREGGGIKKHSTSSLSMCEEKEIPKPIFSHLVCPLCSGLTLTSRQR